MNLSFPVPVYSSQLDSFLLCADTLAVAISKITSTKKLSAFKRNDYLAIALGYKGHSDLIHAAKFHSQQDAGEQLRLFCHAGITSAIIETYCSKITGLDRKQFVLACEHLSERKLSFSRTSKTEGKKDWQIRISIDTWGGVAEDSQVFVAWNNFKGWFCSFAITERSSVTERVKSYRGLNLVTQYAPLTTVDKIRDNLESTVDHILFDLFIVSEDNEASYGHLFDNLNVDAGFDVTTEQFSVATIDTDALNKPKTSSTLLREIISTLSNSNRRRKG